MVGSSLRPDEPGQGQVSKLALFPIAPGGREMCSWEQEAEVVTPIPLAVVVDGGAAPMVRLVFGWRHYLVSCGAPLIALPRRGVE